MQLKSTDVITILGQRGTGKSTLMKMIASQKLRKVKVVIYDPLIEHSKMGLVTHKPEVSQVSRTVVQPPRDTDEFFEKLCLAVWNHGNIIFMVDEADKHETTHVLTPNFDILLNRGRHKGVGIVCISRRAALLNSSVPGLSNHVFSFRLVLPNDVKYFMEFVGPAGERVATLPDYNYLHYDTKNLTIGKTKRMG